MPAPCLRSCVANSSIPVNREDQVLMDSDEPSRGPNEILKIYESAVTAQKSPWSQPPFRWSRVFRPEVVIDLSSAEAPSTANSSMSQCYTGSPYLVDFEIGQTFGERQAS